MEFKLVAPMENDFIKSIQFNKAEIMQELKNALVKYENIAYDAGQMKDAKADRANLNKFKDALETERKRIKKLVLEPYEKFEADIKDILALIDKPILAIDCQIKAFEEEKKKEKREIIQRIYDHYIYGYEKLYSLAEIYNAKWENATFGVDKIEAEIRQKVENFQKGLQAVEAIDGEFKKQVMDKFLTTKDLSQALFEKSRLEQQKRDLEAIALEKKRQQAQAQAQSAAANVNEPIKQQAQEIAQENKEDAQLYYLSLKIFATKTQLAQLKEFLTTNNMKWERI